MGNFLRTLKNLWKEKFFKKDSGKLSRTQPSFYLQYNTRVFCSNMSKKNQQVHETYDILPGVE